jgi:phage-related protein
MNSLRKIVWIGGAKEDLKKFPNEVKDEIGHSLYLTQLGKKPRNTKQLKWFSNKIMEIVSNFDTNTYRAIYTTKLDKHIYVLHCFQKKSKSGIKTPQKDINLIKQRLLSAKNLQL